MQDYEIEWLCPICQTDMVTVGRVPEALSGSSPIRWCIPNKHMSRFIAPGGTTDEQLRHFPRAVWRALREGQLPSDLTDGDVDALVSHSGTAARLYGAGRKALLDEQQRRREAHP